MPKEEHLPVGNTNTGMSPKTVRSSLHMAFPAFPVVMEIRTLKPRIFQQLQGLNDGYERREMSQNHKMPRSHPHDPIGEPFSSLVYTLYDLNTFSNFTVMLFASKRRTSVLIHIVFVSGTDKGF